MEIFGIHPSDKKKLAIWKELSSTKPEVGIFLIKDEMQHNPYHVDTYKILSDINFEIKNAATMKN